jgi:acetoin utilization protein AcuB
MRVKDIMSTDVEAVRPDETLERAHARMRRRGIHHLVVMDHRELLGILTEGVLALREAEGVARVADAMIRPVARGTPEMRVSQAATLMRGHADGSLPVFSGSRLVGIVTISDLLDVLGRSVDRRFPEPRVTRKGRSIKSASPGAHGRPPS